MTATASNSEAPLRAFVAVHVPAAIQEQIVRAVDGVRHRIPEKSVRWVQVGNIHLTLRFIGNVSSQDIEALKSAIQTSAQGVKSFALQLCKTGCFPNDRAPRVLWMGVTGNMELLRRLQLQIAEGTGAWGREGQQDFHPHLTFGRVTTTRCGDLARIATSTRAASVPQSAPWRIDSVHLVQSVTAPGGSEYSTLASFPLIGRRWIPT